MKSKWIMLFNYGSIQLPSLFFDYRLFGPRKKMTNAIARWQSKAPMPTDNKLEQAYADRLEGEMQEMALQLLKVSDALGCP